MKILIIKIQLVMLAFGTAMYEYIKRNGNYPY
jgi:hypothetical protein